MRKEPDARGWSDHDAVLLRCVDELLDERTIRGATRERLAEHFSDQQILDVIAIHGMYVTLGCMINTWGLPLDQFVQERLPASVSREEFERA